jgi:hypothetical protein
MTIALPRPGPLYGLYPQRREADAAWLAGPWRRLRAALAGAPRQDS